MDDRPMFAAPHRRRNRLTGEWVLVSPQRTDQPWQGQVEPAALEQQPDYDPNCYLCPGNDADLTSGERIVCANEGFVAVAPFWAVWPYETLVLPRTHHGALPDLDYDDHAALADILRQLTRRYDRLFDVTFPYSMGLHQRPTEGASFPEWHLHGHFYPPPLCSATVRKFIVGYELLGQPQRDITPEVAAQRLREVVGG